MEAYKNKIREIKKHLLLIFIPVLVLIAGCENASEEKASVVPEGMTEIDLSSYGLAITINVPDTTENKLEIINQSWGATEIKAGKDFHLSIIDDQGDMALAKSDISSNDVNKFKKYLVEEPNAILYESEITEPEFHFYVIVKTDKASYVIEDIKGGRFSEKAAKEMFESAKSIKAKKMVPAS